MFRLRETIKRETGKIPMLYHFLWKGKILLSSGRSSIKVVTISEATNLTLKWAESLPNKFDVIIGIPRSGLWIAGILALKFGKPLSTPNAFVQGEVWHSLHVEKPDIHNVLLVEDDVLYGRQIMKAFRQLKEFDPTLKIEKASLFVTSKAKKLVDHYYAVKNPPLFYEWTLLTNMANLGKLAVDMDGVLCENCPANIDSKDQHYIKWLITAKPYMIPQYNIEAIITSRLEKHRGLTEAWLKQHNVKYNRILMLNLKSKSDRNLDLIIKHKVDSIREIQPFWFWESNLMEAKAIKRQTHLPVLCISNMTLLL